MNIASIEIAVELAEGHPPHLDGKLRLTVEDDTVMIHADTKRGQVYLLAEVPMADFQRAMQLLGVIDTREPAND